MEDDMSRARLTVRFDGPALAEHRFDVRELAPALLAFGQLFDALNESLNGEAATVKVQVVATEPGSFGIDLEVAQQLAQQAMAILTGDVVESALNLKEIIFGVVGGGVLGLIALLRWLRGRAPDRIESLGDDMVRLTLDEETITVPLKVLRAYQDIAVRIAIEHAVARPLQGESVDTMIFEEGEAVLTRVTSDEAAALRAPELPEETLVDDVRQAAFTIVSLAFKEDNKWRLHDGQNQIHATIADEAFLRRVDQNLVRFSKNDVLVCTVRYRQTQTARGLVSEHTVLKVIEHRAAARQLRLDIEPRQLVPEELPEDRTKT